MACHAQHGFQVSRPLERATHGHEGQRSLHGDVRSRRVGALPVRHRRMGRPHRDLASTNGEEAERRSRRATRPDGRATAGAATRRSRSGVEGERRCRAPSPAGRTAATGGRLRLGQRLVDRDLLASRRSATSGRPGPPIADRCRSAGRSIWGMVRVLPTLARGAGGRASDTARRRAASGPHCRDGLRHRLFTTGQPHWRHESKGSEQLGGGCCGRCRLPLGHRIIRWRPPRRRSSIGDRGRRHALRAGVRATWHAVGTGHRLPVLARSPLGHRTSRLVRSSRRWLHPVRREPAEAVRRHLPARLRDRRVARDVGRLGRRGPVLDPSRCHSVQGRQSTHEVAAVLGVGVGRVAHRASSDHLLGRGVHASACDGASGQGGLQPVVHLLHVAPVGVGAERLLHRPGPENRRLLPSQRMAIDTRHLDGATAARWTCSVRRSGGAGRNAVTELGYLRSGIRTAGRVAGACRI